jgi:pyruvate,orthophosphate dikinase
MNLAVNHIKKNESNIKIGVCGEHGGEPKSVYFFDQIGNLSIISLLSIYIIFINNFDLFLGVDYISCSPYKIPIAKIAAAQAHIDYVHSKFIDRFHNII